MGERQKRMDMGSITPAGRGAILVSALLFGFLIFQLGDIYGFLIFPDEFAYWSYAAWAAGYDWSDITSLGAYFSYGYSLILTPVFMLCGDAVTAYRVAVSLNCLLLLASYALLVSTVRRLLPDRNMPVPLFAAFAILVPWNLFYAQMTMTESLLVFLYIAAGSLMSRYLESGRLRTLFLLMLTLLYSYTVHMRTVGILLSALLLLSVHILFRGERRWHLAVAVGTALLLFALSQLLKDRAFATVYRGIDPVLAADNDYSGQFTKLRVILTAEGLRDLAVTAFGGILYLGLATFGLFYWGIYGLLRSAAGFLREFRAVRRRTAAVPEETARIVRGEMACYLLLTVAAQVAVASVHLTGCGEVDDYTYGRFSEMIVPFVMVVGLAVLWRVRARRALAVTAVLAAVHAAGLALVARQIAHTGTERFMGYFMVGISYLYREQDYTVERFYAGVWLLCELLTLGVCTLVLLCRSCAGRRRLLALFAAVELALAVRADSLYLTSFKKAAFRDTRVADKVTELCENGGQAVYMDHGGLEFADILQFMARDVDIRVMECPEEPEHCGGAVSERDVLVFAFDDGYAEKWVKFYSYKDTYGHFTILYNN